MVIRLKVLILLMLNYVLTIFAQNNKTSSVSKQISSDLFWIFFEDISWKSLIEILTASRLSYVDAHSPLTVGRLNFLYIRKLHYVKIFISLFKTTFFLINCKIPFVSMTCFVLAKIDVLAHFRPD